MLIFSSNGVKTNVYANRDYQPRQRRNCPHLRAAFERGGGRQDPNRVSTRFIAHRRTSFADRAAKMRKAAEILESEKDRWARMMTTEMGKTLKSAGDEALKCALGLPLLRGQRREVSGR